METSRHKRRPKHHEQTDRSEETAAGKTPMLEDRPTPGPAAAVSPTPAPRTVRPAIEPVLRRRGILQTLRHAWLPALCLGLGVGVLTSRAVWQLQYRPKPVYRAQAALKVDWTHPWVKGLLAEGSKASADERTLALADAMRSRSVLQEVLRISEASDTPNQTVIGRTLEQGLRVESNGSQVVHVSLDGTDAEQLPALVNAVQSAFVRVFVDQERQTQRARMGELEKQYKDLQKDLVRSRRDLQMADSKMDEDKTLQPQLEEYQKQLARAEVELVSARARLAGLKDTATKDAPTAAEEEEVAKTVDKFLDKDQKLREMKEEADQILVRIRNLERVSPQPRRLVEYTDSIDAHQAILRAMERRRRAIRPAVERKVREIIEDNREETPLEKARNEVALYEAQVKDLKQRVKDKSKAVAVLGEGRRMLAARRSETIAEKTQEIEKLDKQSRTLLEQADRIRSELNRPLPAIKLDAATTAEMISNPGEGGLRRAALAGLFALGLVGLVVSYREHRQARMHAADNILEELSLPLLASVPALAGSLDLFSAPLDESQPGSEFQERCAAIDAICPVVLQAGQEGQARVVLVTSAVGAEGESELASHLAYRLARCGKRTLLVDSDILQPRLHRILGETGEPGLGDVLRNQVAWSDVIRPTQLNDLWFVPAGKTDYQAADALARDDIEPLLAQLRPEYDVILLDACAVLRSTYGVQLARHADGVIVSVRREQSRAIEVFAAHQRLHMLNIPVLGAVFVGQTSLGLAARFQNFGASLKSTALGGASLITGVWKWLTRLEPPVPTSSQAPGQEPRQRRVA